MLSGKTLFGTVYTGGVGSYGFGGGTVFALTLGLPALTSLTIVRTGNQYLLSWPSSAASYVLQTTASLNPGNWSSISNGIGTLSNNYIYSNAMTGGTAFFRLRSP